MSQRVRKPLTGPHDTPLVGRRPELRDTLAALRRHRLVSLVGMAGVGKSRLACAVAEARRGDTLFVALAAVRHADDIAPAIVGAASWSDPSEQHGEPPPGRSVEPFERISKRLADTETLIVLDNLEQIAGAAATVSEILACCPSVRILATSQILLHATDEHVIQLAPLPVPPPGGAPLDIIAACPSFELLVQVARRADPTFEVTGSNTDALATLCALLDGLPLALELAGARLGLLPPEELVALLGDRHDILRRRTTGGRADAGTQQGAGARHDTLRDAVEWSYRLLDPTRQSQFAALSVFEGGFGCEAAAAVVGVDVADAIDLLEELVDRSLIRLTAGPATAARFEMLGTLRHVMNDHLSAAGDEPHVRRAHARWCAALVDDALPQLSGPDLKATLDLLETEHANLRVALEWLIDDEPTGEVALQMVTRLHDYWWRRARGTEGRWWMQRALDGYRGATCAALAEAWEKAGDLAEEHGDLDASQRCLQRASELFDELHDRAGIARCMNTLGLLHRHRGDLAECTALHRRALQISDELDDARGRIVALDRLAGAAYFGGDLDQAAEMWERALPYLRQRGNDASLAMVMGNLGAVMMARDTPRRALGAFREALRLQEQLGDRPAIGRTSIGLGECHLLLGELDDAEARLLDGLEITRDKDDRYPTAEALLLLARVTKRRGRWADAALLALDSFDEFIAAGMRSSAARPLSLLATMAAADGRCAEAVTWFAIADRWSGELRLVGLDATERTDWETVARHALPTAERTRAAAVGATWPPDEVRMAAHAMATRFHNGREPSRWATSPAQSLLQLGLTAREAEVATLLARRHTDQEIAASLFISTRTAGAHVSAVLRKLGVRSRRDVADALRRNGGKPAANR